MLQRHANLSRSVVAVLPLLTALVLAAPAAPGRGQAAARLASERPAGSLAPVTDAMLQSPAPEDWLMWRRTLDGWGYSPLDEIDRDNVGTLRMVWSRALAMGLQQATPLVHEQALNDIAETLSGFIVLNHEERPIPLEHMSPPADDRHQRQTARDRSRERRLQVVHGARGGVFEPRCDSQLPHGG